MVFFKIYLYGKTSFHLSIFDTWAEMPYPSGFQGGKMVLVGVKDEIWAEKAYFCKVVK